MSDSLHSPDDSFKTNDSDDSIYPQFNLKGIRMNSQKSSPHAKAITPSSHQHLSFFQEPEVVLEEPEEPTSGQKQRPSRGKCDEDTYMTSSKSKFKHLNIVTDSGEFNSNSANTITNNSANNNRSSDLMNSSCGSASRFRNSSVDVMQSSNDNVIVEEHRAADEDENSECRPQLLKLSENSMHLIDDILQLDPGEFYHNSSASTPKKSGSKPLMLSRKSSHSSIFAQITSTQQQDDLVIQEELEPKEDEIQKKGAAFMLEKLQQNIIADEVDVQNVHRSQYFMTQSAPIIEEEPKEDEQFTTPSSQLRANTAAKQERDSKIEYINKIVKGDEIQDAQRQRMATSIGSSHLITHVPLDKIISEDAEVVEDE